MPDLLPPNSKSLNRRSSSVKITEFGSPLFNDGIKSMLKVAHGLSNKKVKRTMVGLAAPQIGLNRRIILVDLNTDGTDNTQKPNFLILINPKIIYKSAHTVEGREGCFSTGNVCGVVERANKISIKALNDKGVMSIYRFTGFTQRIVQHEIDHLNGIRFPDRIVNNQKLHWVEKSEFSLYRKKWQKWDKICPRQRYLDMIK